jgi:hypothetical protein
MPGLKGVAFAEPSRNKFRKTPRFLGYFSIGSSKPYLECRLCPWHMCLAKKVWHSLSQVVINCGKLRSFKDNLVLDSANPTVLWKSSFPNHMCLAWKVWHSLSQVVINCGKFRWVTRSRNSWPAATSLPSSSTTLCTNCATSARVTRSPFSSSCAPCLRVGGQVTMRAVFEKRG